MSTRGVVVSIAGCRLKTRLSRIFFYRQPSRQASTTCPFLALKQLNFWMQFSPQPGRLMNLCNDLFNLDFSPPVLSPNGHIEATRLHPRITCSKGEEGYVGLCWPWSEGEGGSPVKTKRRRKPKVMWGGGEGEV